MSAIPKQKLSIEEYIEFDKSNEGKWEYFDGEVLDMAGGSLNHNRITRNVLAALQEKLAGTPCEALPSDMRLKVPAALPYRYPDVVVVCGEPVIEILQGQELLVNPRLIVEVLSASTKAYDCDLKFTAYQSIESFEEYLLIAQDRPHITQYVRQRDDGWLRQDIGGMEAAIRLATVECELTLAEIYHQLKFSPAESGMRLV
jgi:Uma2 family endonuclease